MARAMFNIWSCLSLLIISSNYVEGIGVNWGNQASHPLHPEIVVKMLQDNGIKKVKLFDADSWTVSSLAGKGIQVMLGIPNNQLHHISKNYDNAKDWVKENCTKHLYDGGVDIRYVAVGNEPFLKAYNGSFTKITLPAMQNIQKALNAAGVGDKIKVTTPINADVYESSSNSPSDGNFRKDIKDVMLDIVNFLSSNKSPFVVNIYPFLSLYLNSGFPVDFAFFDGGHPIRDKGVQYTNVLDANYDTLVWTLRKNKVSDLKIIIGEVGWPTDGHTAANLKYAKKFYDGLFKKLATGKGTPLRPGKLDVYLFSLLDEDMKSVEPGFFERHWGIFRFDGKPKFPMDFSGKGDDKMPVGAKGVEYLTAQWCVFQQDDEKKDKIGDQVSYACSNGDCTALGYGSSCNDLNLAGNYSYAFNMYFQMQDQNVEACDFDGLGKITKQNASKGSCLFPIQIVSQGLRRSNFGFRVFGGVLLALFVLIV